MIISCYIYKRLYTAIGILSLLPLTGCSNSDRDLGQHFSSHEVAKIKTVPINEILKPIDISISRNYICILHEEKSDGDQIYVYSADSMTFKYSFARRGHGPEESWALDMAKNMRGDTIDLIDQANYKHLSYTLTDNGPRLNDVSYFEIPNMGPLQEVYWINDSILLFNSLDGILHTYNVVGKTIVDEFSLADSYPEFRDEETLRFFGFNYACCDSTIYVGMRFFDEIITGKVNSCGLMTFDSMPRLDMSAVDTKSMYDNTGYNAFICADSRRVISQYYGFSMKEMQPFPYNIGIPNLKFSIDIYDRNLVPVMRLDPEMDFMRLFYDHYRNRIYLWDAMSDFDKIMYIELR